MDKGCVSWTLLPPEIRRRLGGTRVWRGWEIKQGEVSLLLMVLLTSPFRFIILSVVRNNVCVWGLNK